MFLSHRIQLDPTEKQKAYFRKACDCARFVYNWGLEEWERQYASGENPYGFKLITQFNAIKYDKYPWIKKIHRDAHQRPFFYIQRAYDLWRTGKKGKPKFKKKGKCRDSFYVSNQSNVMRVSGKVVKLPKIGIVRMREALRFEGKIVAATVTRTADKWFISIRVDVGDYRKERIDDRISGVDLGLTHVATLSNGLKFEAPKPLKKNIKKLKRLSRMLSRKQKGSKNREKAKLKLARLHARIVNQRKDFTHKLTACLCKNHAGLVIEDLSTQFILKNRKLSKSVSDIGFYEIRRQLEYKSLIYRCCILIASRWYPSSKTCFVCGNKKKDLTLKDRIYECSECGMNLDRDVNAALNLRKLFWKNTVGSTGIHACGPEGSGRAAGDSDTTKPCWEEAGTTQTEMSP